ncbi:cytochrome P450 [Favolaschia claudopus]|uniref:Cytochrome P450 n=1 Tax=Favolaschia claudopus TaxID=2862362 RepID=A0AAW0CDF4_9AGAR
MFLKLFFSSLGVYGLYRILRLLYEEYNSPLKYLPGPKSAHWIFGNMKGIWNAENSVLHEQWTREYGSTLKYKGLFGLTRLYTTDTKALNHFLSSYNYRKPEQVRYTLSRIVGPGVLITEGDVHKQQRRILNPAFGAPQVREVTGIFVEKSIELRDVWAAQIAQSGSARLDVLSWLSRATLDIIGLAGFNYNFNSLASEQQTALGEAFATTFRAGFIMNPVRMLQTVIPAFRFIRTDLDRVMEKSQAVMRTIGLQLLEDSKREMVQNGSFEKGHSRDLLSLLVRANTSKDLPSHQRLSDEDVLAQVPTFLVAGHETTSTATTWALFALTQNVAAQTRLRNELLTLSTDNPTMDELNALPYLDCVVRETLRIHAPVPSTLRVAAQDDVVPLAHPFTDIHGNVHETLEIKKGQTIMIPILAMNRDPAIWGPNSMEFVPERWLESSISTPIPGVWGHMLSFLGGPRSCIGYRFSLVEMKALLFTLVRAFEFELAIPASDLGKKSAVVQRPIIKSDPAAGNQMPLLIRPYGGH